VVYRLKEHQDRRAAGKTITGHPYDLHTSARLMDWQVSAKRYALEEIY